MEQLKLVKPSVKHERQVLDYQAEMLTHQESFDGCACLEEVQQYDEWLQFEERLSKKYGKHYVPSEVYLAIRVCDGRLIGMIDYRHPLSASLLWHGGNIGYSVRPLERRQGYAKEMLRQMLHICQQRGMDKVLLTCDQANLGSAKTIISQGGMLENEITDLSGRSKSGIIQRYWIDVSAVTRGDMEAATP